MEHDSRSLLNDPGLPRASRIAALAALVPDLPLRARDGASNNHIHTCYSFSPYTPSAAALAAREAGLEVAGSVDHDSIAAAAEMREAALLLGLGCVTGCELRVSMARGPDGKPGPFADRKINSPDSPGLAYMTIQGVPEWGRARLDEFLRPVRERRARRTRDMTDAANLILRDAGIAQGRGPAIDFERDILARSKSAEGGGITERHLLAAVARLILATEGPGLGLPESLARKLGVRLSAKQQSMIGDAKNPHLEYDLLGLLKGAFLDRLFIQPDEAEIVDMRKALELALSAGAIPAYAYLGDVEESPTGDKKAERFEDGFIEELFAALDELGIRAVTYMPPRNTASQLARVRALCRRHGFMEISGVDINQPRQSFDCPELRRPEFAHLADATWAMVAHEALSSADPALGIFSPTSPCAGEALDTRIGIYARAGRTIDPADGDSAALVARRLKEGRY